MKLTGQRNQCQACKQYFNSNKAFDLHRRGSFNGGRRCLTSDEMIAKGMSLNAAGFWISEKMSEGLINEKRSKQGKIGRAHV